MREHAEQRRKEQEEKLRKQREEEKALEEARKRALFEAQEAERMAKLAKDKAAAEEQQRKAQEKLEKLRKKQEEAERLAEKLRKRKAKEERLKLKMQKKLEAAMETGYLRWTQGFKRHSVYWKEKEHEKEDSGLVEDPVDYAGVLNDGKHKLKFDPVIHGDDKLVPRDNSKSSRAGSRAGSKSAKKDRQGATINQVPQIGKIQSQMIKSPKIGIDDLDKPTTQIAKKKSVKPEKQTTKQKAEKPKEELLKKKAKKATEEIYSPSKFKPTLGLAKKENIEKKKTLKKKKKSSNDIISINSNQKAKRLDSQSSKRSIPISAAGISHVAEDAALEFADEHGIEPFMEDRDGNTVDLKEFFKSA